MNYSCFYCMAAIGSFCFFPSFLAVSVWLSPTGLGRVKPKGNLYVVFKKAE